MLYWNIICYKWLETSCWTVSTPCRMIFWCISHTAPPGRTPARSWWCPPGHDGREAPGSLSEDRQSLPGRRPGPSLLRHRSGRCGVGPCWHCRQRQSRWESEPPAGSQSSRDPHQTMFCPNLHIKQTFSFYHSHLFMSCYNVTVSDICHMMSY